MYYCIMQGGVKRLLFFFSPRRMPLVSPLLTELIDINITVARNRHHPERGKEARVTAVFRR